MNLYPLTAALVSFLITLPVIGAEPPLCDDPKVLADLQSAYAELSKAYNLPKIERVEPRESALLDYDIRLDTPRNQRLIGGYPWGQIRFCIATLRLQGKTTETAYFRIDAFKDMKMIARLYPEANGATYGLNPCFESHDKLALAQNHEEMSEENICSPFRRP